MSDLADEGTLLGRGISFPPRLGPDGRIQWSIGSQNIRESIRVILMTVAGERVMRPAFGAGVPTFLFEPNVVTTHRLIQERIGYALGRWEPRIRVTRLAVDVDPDDLELANVSIEYQLVATQERGELGLAIRVAG